MKLIFMISFLWLANSYARTNPTAAIADSNTEEVAVFQNIPSEQLNSENDTDEVNAIEELVIVDDLTTLSEWLETYDTENEVLIYTDDEGNEYYIIEEKYAHATNTPKVKTRKKRKGSKRNCVAAHGGASWYGPGFHGKKTANGERFNQHDLTAAHKTIRFNSLVRVTYKGRSVVVRINDAGPYVKGRVIDLSKAAAKELGLITAGHGHVQIEIIRCGDAAPQTRVVRITAQ